MLFVVGRYVLFLDCCLMLAVVAIIVLLFGLCLLLLLFVVCCRVLFVMVCCLLFSVLGCQLRIFYCCLLIVDLLLVVVRVCVLSVV